MAPQQQDTGVAYVGEASAASSAGDTKKEAGAGTPEATQATQEKVAAEEAPAAVSKPRVHNQTRLN